MVTPWHSKADTARHSADVERQLDLIDYLDGMASGRVVTTVAVSPTSDGLETGSRRPVSMLCSLTARAALKLRYVAQLPPPPSSPTWRHSLMCVWLDEVVMWLDADASEVYG